MTRTTHVTRRPPGAGAPASRTPRTDRRRVIRRRRRWALFVMALVVLGMLGAGWYQVHQSMPSWYARMWYPLDYETAIVEESRRNGLDPTLVAAVIYTESGFIPDSRSGQGAVGLMQMLPSTAQFVASQPGRPSPSPDDLEDPRTNIAYGTRYLRYLIDRHDSVPLALAAYNGGESNVAQWLARARREGRELRVPEGLPFPETRGFVRRVLDAQPIYQRTYGDRLR